MHHPALLPPPLTEGLPGTGGRLRMLPEDFDVTELPAYEPSGQGEHCYLWVEKRGVGHEFFVNQVARRLQVHPADVGTAGMKDRHAVTRQWVSVPRAAEPNLPKLDGDGIHLLSATKHTNKLKPGHLRGNRFRVLIRDAVDVSLEPALARLRAEGLPNYYGPQRFGRDHETAVLGLAMLRGEKVARPNPFLRKLALSAAQSLLFNDVLMRRVADGLYRTVLAGDVMMKYPAGGLFVATDVPVEQARFDRRETVTGGPMFGAKTFAAADVAAGREAKVLAENGIATAMFEGFGKLVQGTRRHNIVYVDDLAAAREPDGLRLSFTLPAGSYATVLLREVMKTAIEDGANFA